MNRTLPHVLIVEDDDSRTEWMMREAPLARWHRARTEQEALHYLAQTASGQREPYRAVFLDYDLHGSYGGGGEHVAAALIRGHYQGIVVVHSSNLGDGAQMAVDLARHRMNVIHAPAYRSPKSPSRWRFALRLARHS